MSTNDVPGANPVNGDTLNMGAWAEHADGSLIFVESTEAQRVIYSIFDLAKDPPIEYRDALPESTFKSNYSWKTSIKSIKWTWHDKTPFPWDRVIKHGATDGPRSPSAAATLTAAQRLAESLRLRGAELDTENIEYRLDTTLSKFATAMNRFSDMVGNMGKKKGRRH